jgi:hypothetical protein
MVVLEGAHGMPHGNRLVVITYGAGSVVTSADVNSITYQGKSIKYDASASGCQC